jgi:ABC-2 type transport system ATP-binding protein
MKQTRAPADSTPVLSVQHLSKSYTQLLAVNDVPFGIGRREIVGLLGPNGAPTAGSIRIGSFDVARQLAAALARTNFAAVYATLLARYSAETVS